MNKTYRSRYRPVYKKFVGLRKVILNPKKVLNFKKRKWQPLISQMSRLSKKRKNNCYYKFYDQTSYKIQKYNSFFSRSYSQNLSHRKRFSIFYGFLGKNYLKHVITNSLKKSNQVQNKINPNLFLIEFLESRLDVILVRSGFSLSLMNSRQMISHGHVFVNKKRVKDGSYSLKPDDLITFSKKSRPLVEHFILRSEIWPLPPQYLQISYKVLQIKIVDNIISKNSGNFMPLDLNLTNIIEHYRR